MWISYRENEKLNEESQSIKYVVLIIQMIDQFQNNSNIHIQGTILILFSISYLFRNETKLTDL